MSKKKIFAFIFIQTRIIMNKYQIIIDGIPYESAKQINMAMHLYNTVDETCLNDYYGHQKELIADGNTIRSDRIRIPLEKGGGTKVFNKTT